MKLQLSVLLFSTLIGVAYPVAAVRSQECDGCVEVEPTPEDQDYIDRMTTPDVSGNPDQGNPDDFANEIQNESNGLVSPDNPQGPDVTVERNPETGAGVIHFNYENTDGMQIQGDPNAGSSDQGFDSGDSGDSGFDAGGTDSGGMSDGGE